MPHPLYGSVVEVDVGQLDLFVRDRGDIHREAVVLCGDLDLPGRQILDRLVAAVMSELELIGPSTEGQP